MLKNRPPSLTEAVAVISRTFLKSRGQTHYEMLLSLHGYKLSMWQGCVRVCLSVPCSFEECPQSARSSATASKPESKYHLSRSSETERPVVKNRYLHLTFTSLYPFNSSVNCWSNLSGKKITCCELRAAHNVKFTRSGAWLFLELEKHIFNFQRSNGTVDLPRAKVKEFEQGSWTVIKIYGVAVTG